MGDSKSSVQCNVRRVYLCVNREFMERVVVPRVTYGVKTCGMRMDERDKLDNTELELLWSMSGITMKERVKIEKMRPELV